MNKVISTRIRFARNLKEYPFVNRMTDAQKKELCNKVKEAFFGANSSMKQEYDYIELANAPRINLISLAEQNIISPQFVAEKAGALILSKDKTLSIMINEEDHLRIQVLIKGNALGEAYEKAKLIDSLLNESLHFACSKKYGYLTSCPSNLGTGMRASLMVHLPAITELGALNSLIREADRTGLTVRGAEGEGSRAKGSLYQLSNSVTLGLTDKEIISRLEKAWEQISKEESALAKSYFENQGIGLEDKIMRAKGILENARILSLDEFLGLYSLLRLGIELDLIDRSFRQKLDDLYYSCKDATLILNNGNTLERNILRAQLCRNAFN